MREGEWETAGRPLLVRVDPGADEGFHRGRRIEPSEQREEGTALLRGLVANDQVARAPPELEWHARVADLTREVHRAPSGVRRRSLRRAPPTSSRASPDAVRSLGRVTRKTFGKPAD